MSAIRSVAGLMAAVVVCWSGAAMAGQASTPTQVCEAKKNEVAGGKLACLTKERGVEVQGATPDYAECHENFMRTYPGLEQKAGPGVCPTEGDAEAIEATLDACQVEVAQALSSFGLPFACEAKKNELAGGLASCLAKERATEVKGGTPNYAKCDRNFAQTYAGMCPKEGDAAAIAAIVDSCMGDVAQALTGLVVPPPPGCPPVKLPGSGQTTCWNSAGQVISCAGTGQDGHVRPGGGLSYTDNGNGTITDNITRLTWEKKSDDDTIHDKDRMYTWGEAFVHVAGLNQVAFAGHTDWRLPNAKELMSIVNFEKVGPAVSAAFNTKCESGCTVLTCSCTSGVLHWSSTTAASDPQNAWYLLFFSGVLVESSKSLHTSAVRAVKGGR